MSGKPDTPEAAPTVPHPDAGVPVATPEGDNEFAPDQPLVPIDRGQQKPPAIDTNKL